MPNVVKSQIVEKEIHVISEGQVGPAGTPGPMGPQGPSGTGYAPTSSLLNTSGAMLPTVCPVSINADGSISPADAATKYKVMGFVATDPIPNNTYGLVQTDGQIDALTTDWDVVTGSVGGLIKGARYFLSTTPGRITNLPDISNNVASVGRASSTTRLVIDIEPPILA